MLDPVSLPVEIDDIIFLYTIYEYISRLKSGRNGRYQLPDVIDLMCYEKNLYGYIIQENT
ncbi:MAG: hypothetical protein QXU18_02460 [Thermoplasmatales archaeon]